MAGVAPGPTRRQWLTLATAASMMPARAAGPADRFSAIARPARAVVRPDKAVLLAGALVGTRVVAVGERGVVALSDDGARSWNQAEKVPVSTTLTAVRFADAANGWAVGHGGVILATSDGGRRWVLQADGRALAAAAANAAAAHSSNVRAAALAKEAQLLVEDGPDKPLFDIFVDSRPGTARHVVVVGAYNLFFETTDGGAHWAAALERLDNPKAQHLYAIAAHGDEWLIAGEQGLLLKSRDGGRSFSRMASPYAGTWFTAVATAAGEFVVAGLRGEAWRTTDGGEHWSRLEGAPPASFASAVLMPDGAVLLANQAGQVFTTRGGSALSAWPGAGVPPLAQALPLPGGELLALGGGGAQRLPGRSA